MQYGTTAVVPSRSGTLFFTPIADWLIVKGCFFQLKDPRTKKKSNHTSKNWPFQALTSGIIILLLSRAVYCCTAVVQYGPTAIIPYVSGAAV